MTRDDEEITRPDLDLANLAWLASNATLDGEPIATMLGVHARNRLRRDCALRSYGILPDDSCTKIIIQTMAQFTTLRDRGVFLANVSGSASREDFLDACLIALDSISRSR